MIQPIYRFHSELHKYIEINSVSDVNKQAIKNREKILSRIKIQNKNKAIVNMRYTFSEFNKCIDSINKWNTPLKTITCQFIPIPRFIWTKIY